MVILRVDLSMLLNVLDDGTFEEACVCALFFVFLFVCLFVSQLTKHQTNNKHANQTLATVPWTKENHKPNQ
jgi:hypothetical protein